MRRSLTVTLGSLALMFLYGCSRPPQQKPSAQGQSPPAVEAAAATVQPEAPPAGVPDPVPPPSPEPVKKTLASKPRAASRAPVAAPAVERPPVAREPIVQPVYSTATLPEPQAVNTVPPAPTEPVLPPTRPAAPAPPPLPATATLRAGTPIDVRLTQNLSSATAEIGDTFTLTLQRDLTVDGNLLAPRGSTVTGRVVEASGAGRVKGKAHLALALSELRTRTGTYAIETSTISFEAQGSAGKDAKVIGGTAGLGAIIGAIAGGGKGAAIGAAIGGATGTAGVMMTKGKEIELLQEQKFTFRLERDVEMKIDRTGPQDAGPPDTSLAPPRPPDPDMH